MWPDSRFALSICRSRFSRWRSLSYIHTHTADSPVISYAGPFSAIPNPIKAMLGFGLGTARSRQTPPHSHPHPPLRLSARPAFRGVPLSLSRHASKSVAFSPFANFLRQTRPSAQASPPKQRGLLIDYVQRGMVRTLSPSPPSARPRITR
jgi:hypothetical protein